MNLLQGRWCTQTSLTSPLTPFSTAPVLSICAQQSLETPSLKVPGRTISPQISLLLTSMQREAGGKEISPTAHPSGEPVESANEEMLKNCKKDTAPKERRGEERSTDSKGAVHSWKGGRGCTDTHSNVILAACNQFLFPYSGGQCSSTNHAEPLPITGQSFCQNRFHAFQGIPIHDMRCRLEFKMVNLSEDSSKLGTLDSSSFG